MLVVVAGMLLLAAILQFTVPKQPVTLKNDGIDRVVSEYVPPEGQKPKGSVGPSFLPPQPKLLNAQKIVTVPILLYHYVEYNHDLKDTIRTSLSVTPFWFEKQLQYLKSNGYAAITLDDVRRAVLGYQDLPKKPVVLTFDDGYRDFYTDALPLLRRYNTAATIFVVPDFLDKPNYLFSWQLSQIATGSGGLITIGAHTKHHAYLPKVKPDLAWDEIFGSKRELEERFNVPVTVFAYPYGAFDAGLAEVVRKAGFKAAVSTIFGRVEDANNLFYLPRIRAGNYGGALFASRLEAK